MIGRVGSSSSFNRCSNSFVCFAVSVAAHVAFSDSSNCGSDATISLDTVFSGRLGLFRRMILSLEGRAADWTDGRASFMPDRLSLIFVPDEEPGTGVDAAVEAG